MSQVIVIPVKFNIGRLIITRGAEQTLNREDMFNALKRHMAGDWGELGGTPGPITVVHKADGRSTQEVFLANFEMDPGDVEASVVIGDNEQGVKSVAGNPAAIGYVSIGAAEASIGMGVSIKLVALDGHGPTSEAVAKGSFPLVRELNLVTMGELSPLVVEFIAFSRSPGAREFIEAHHFVALD